MISIGKWAVLGVALISSAGWGSSCPTAILKFAPFRPGSEGGTHNFTRDAAVYFVDSLFQNKGGLSLADSSSEILFDPENIRWGFRQMLGELSGRDYLEQFTLLRKFSERGIYNHTRNIRQNFQIPLRQSKLIARLRLGEDVDLRLWKVQVVDSLIKEEKRLIFRSKVGRRSPMFPEGMPRISAATNLKDPFVEMELIVERPNKRGVDYLTYRKGILDTHSQVISSGGFQIEIPSPYACMACHYDARRRTFGFSPDAFKTGLSNKLLLNESGH